LDKYLETNGDSRIAFWERPTAPAASLAGAVLLHSLFFDHAMFGDVVSLLAPGRSLLAPDHRGQGDSIGGSTPPSICQLAADVIALIETQADHPVHLVGSSMGGYVAMEVALRRPELLMSCTLSCCTAEAERQPERFAGLEAALRDKGSAIMANELLHMMFGEQFLREADGATLERWRSHFSSLSRAVPDAVHGAFARPSYVERLSEIRMPVLLFSGAQDRAKRPEDMELIAKHIAGSRHVLFEHSGHTPAIEEPRRFADELERFWHSIESTALAGAQTSTQPQI